MPCYEMEIPTGDGQKAFATVCARGSGIRRKRCIGCGALCDRLCDVPSPGQLPGLSAETCSAPVCTRCSVQLGEDDVCPRHPVPDEALRCARQPVRARVR